MQLMQQKMERGSNSFLKKKLEALPSWRPTKTKGKLAQGTHLGESLENGKGGGVLPSIKKRKDQTKTSTRIISVTIKVILHLHRQKIFLLLLKYLNLKERNASIIFIIFSVHLHFFHHGHLLPWSLQ